MNFLEDLNELIVDFYHLKNKIVIKYKKYSFLNREYEDIMNFMLNKISNIISNIERKKEVEIFKNI